MGHRNSTRRVSRLWSIVGCTQTVDNNGSLRFRTRLPDRPPGHPIVSHSGYGRSLGGGAICQLAANRPLAALILESTFSSVADLARPMGVPSWLVRDPFDNLSVLREYAGPVLLLHGSRDRVIPFRHSERLHDEARQSILRPMTCGHNDCPRPWGEIHEFLVTTEILASGRRGQPSN